MPRANQKELNNPRPLKTPNDFSKLLYRIEVSKDLMKGMLLRAHDHMKEKAKRQEAIGSDLDDPMESELRKLEMQINHEAIVFSLKI
jgi:hypothetical protein